MSWAFVDGQVQKVYAVTARYIAWNFCQYKISSVSASSCVLLML